MSWEAWTTLGMLGVVFTLMACTRIGPDVLLWGAVTVFMTLGIITPAEALSGLANDGMVTVGLLFIVAAGLRETGGMHLVTQRLLGRPQSVKVAQLRLMGPVATMSAFMNNTPLVAMLLPVVDEWTRQLRLSASKFMIPLSYATILGGTCSLIGTSTNLVVNGLIARTTDMPTLRMFDIAWVGVPCTVVGLGYLLLSSRWLLPDRRPAFSTQDDPREYSVEMQVEADSPLVGQTIEQAGLRHLPGLYLMEIDRNGEILPAVSPQVRLHARDQLVFVGVVESVVDLQKVRGLIPATDQVFKLKHPRSRRSLIEAVVSDSCPVVGMTIRDGHFRNLYNAVVIAVARNGERLRQKIGDIVLRAGDTLLLEARPAFVEQQRNSRDFFLVSQVQNSTPRRHERAWVALTILGLMVAVATLGWLSMLNAAMLAAGLMILTGCCTHHDGPPQRGLAGAAGNRRRLWYGAGLAENWYCQHHRAHLPGVGRRQSLGGTGHRLWRDHAVDRTAHQQRRGSADVPHRHGHGHLPQCASSTVRHCRHAGRLVWLCNTYRVSDQPDGLWPGGLSLCRLSAYRDSPGSPHGNHSSMHYSTGMAILSIFAG